MAGAVSETRGEVLNARGTMTDVSVDFKDAVRRRRVALGLQTPSDEILPKKAPRSNFGAESHAALKAIHTTASFLRDTHAAYLMEDGNPNGMTDAERDEIDAETQQFLSACTQRIDKLKAQSAGEAGVGVQLNAHRQATLQLLYEQLGRVAAVFDEHRGHRMRRASEARDQRLGASAEAAGSFGENGVLGTWAQQQQQQQQRAQPQLLASTAGAVLGLARPLTARGDGGGGSSGGGGAATAGGDLVNGASPYDWNDDEVLADEAMDLDASEKAQLEMENEALLKELETMVDQARQAESSMLEISKLTHLFATKVEQQNVEVEMLSQHAEQTSENLVRGNAYLDSAAKHSRDFRLLVMSFLLIASFSLLFLDWYYD